MAYAELDGQSIIRVVAGDTGFEITQDDMDIIKRSKFGHAVYDYINGRIQLNQAKFDSLNLEREKSKEVERAIQEELRFLAEQSAAQKLDAIRRSRSFAELKAARELP